MLRVGLTGGLASGKSFIAGELELLGCAVVQADKLGHQILSEDGEAIAEVERAFGANVLAPDESVDRKALARLVFADRRLLVKLNSIVHPRVFERLDRFFATVAERDPDAIAVVEAAIMIESGSYRRYDRLLVAACPHELQIQRFMARDGASREEAEARMARQIPVDERCRYADYVIDTAGTRADTLRQVREVHRRLLAEVSEYLETGTV